MSEQRTTITTTKPIASIACPRCGGRLDSCQRCDGSGSVLAIQVRTAP